MNLIHTMMKKETFCVLFGILFMLASCVEEYQVPNTASEKYESELVIQGRIFSGEESIIYISKTEPLGSTEIPESIDNAKVYVVGENGYKSNVAQYDTENGYYLIDTKDITNNTTYALLVELEGEIYQSDYLTLQDTPEIDAVTYKERNDGISIHISTHNRDDASRFYMWSYEEDWEFHAPLDFIGINGIPVYNEKIYNVGTSTQHNPYLFCWKHLESSNIFIYGTDHLQENTVKDVELIRIPIEDIRISYIYSILVKQFCLTDEAYNYYRMMKLYTEESSGLFAPMPNELKGNIHCTSNPLKKVYGYILASNITTKRIFIYESDFKEIRSEYENDKCGFLIPDTKDNTWYYAWTEMVNNAGAIVITKSGSFSPFDNPDYLDSKLYYRDCVDCRAVEGSTKKRPDFWPNNHE